MAQRSWWEALALSAVEKLRIRQNLSVLASLEPLIAEVKAEADACRVLMCCFPFVRDVRRGFPHRFCPSVILPVRN